MYEIDAAERHQNQHSLDDSAKNAELSQALLQANKREKELGQNIQQLEIETLKIKEPLQDTVEFLNLEKNKQVMEKRVKVTKQPKAGALDRLEKLNHQVAQALTAISAASLETMAQTLMRDKQLLDTQLADYKVENGIGKDGQTMTLRKEFHQLMAPVMIEHEQAFEKEWKNIVKLSAI
ncbi:hypothetical protein BJV82DRAFT_578053 [Fennellomyces sp. T-0311]|nr:hypothetical protein BJV82DRAFT_578053 [Fennellomyces sp. T-0311]